MAEPSPSPDEADQQVSGGPVNDPFGIDQLSVHYDYLLYRIQDYVTSIQLSTTEICQRQNGLVEKGIIEDVIDVNIREMHHLLNKCEELERHFDMLDQIDSIVQSLGPRLESVAGDHRKFSSGAGGKKRAG